MSSILINALLSSCHDPDTLFNTLCWPTDSWPDTERVEALTTFIDGIGKLPQSDTSDDGDKVAFSIAKRDIFLRKVESIIWTQCLPLLLKVSNGDGACKGKRVPDGRAEITIAVCRLLSVCINTLCDTAVSGQVARAVLPSFQLPDGETEEELPGQGEGRLGIDVAIEAMSVILPAVSSNEELTTSILSSALSCIKTLPDALVSKITVRLIFTLLNCYSEDGIASKLRFILEDLCSWHKSDSSNTDSPVVTERALLCLTTLSDYLFSPAKVQQHTIPQSLSYTRPDPRRSLQFWRILQDGLTHKDNVSRKRALYLLKRCVALSEDEAVEFPSSSVSSEDNEEIIFRWAPDRCKLLREFWEDYALVMETLEENQIHVVRPVLNRIHTLIQTAANDSQGVSLFHPSWLLGVYQRMFHSENKSVMREGVDHLLELQVLRRPAFALAFSQFILGPFMDVMSESSLFHRTAGQSVGECPELGVKLQVFMVTFFSSLPQENRGPVLLQLVQRLGSQHWCAVPILFLSRALSHLPPCPLLGPDGLQALREVLRCTMITHQVLLRGAAQCFLLNSALSLTDVTLVTLDDVFSLLVHFRADESLRRGTPLWNQLCDWLADSEGSFRPCVRESADGTSTSTSPERETVRGYVQHQMELFLRVPASTDQTDSVPDPGEAELLAKAILLCVDIEGRTQRSGGEQTTGVSGGMDSLLRPLLDTLSRLHTNVYLPLRKTDKSLQLLLRLLQLTPARHTPAALLQLTPARHTPAAVLQLTPARHTPAAVEKEQEDSVTVSMETLVLGVVEPIQEFILRRLSRELQELCDVERAELYLSVLKEVVLMYSVLEWNHSKVQEAYFPRLLRYVLRTLEADQIPSVAGQVSRAVAMASLAMTCEVAALGVFNLQSETTILLVHLSSYFYSPAPPPAPPLSLVNFNQTLLKPPTAAQSTGVSEQGPLLKDWGRMAAHFIRDQWTCLGYGRRIGPPGPLELPRASGSLQAAIGALSLLPSGLVLPVLDFMASMLPQVALSEEALCVEAVTVSWKLVLGLSSNPHDFWPTLQGFVTMAFHHSLLELTEEQAPGLTVTLQQIAVELMELSQAKTGVFNVLIQHCCHTWLPSDPGSEGESQSDAMFSSALLHLDILAEACVYGPVFRRDQRLIQEVQVYVERLGEECAANTAVPSDNRDDQFPRVCVVAFLSRLHPSNQLHERLMEELVLRLLKKDEAISKSKQRYYSNSLQHRVKNRVWQTLLMLLPKLRGEFVGTVLGRVFEAGFVSNQASVKYLIEWKMVLILVQYPEHIDRLWACFSVDQEKTKTSVCTFLSVLVHLNIIMPQLKEKAVQWRKALDVILQWCFSHNFSVRLYALLALKRVWGLEGARAEAEEGAGGAGGLGGLATVVKACLHQAEAMQSTGNANKNWTRIQDHFFFGGFHPVRDYSVETIFYTFPSLSEVFEDEWIPPWKFEKLVDFSQSASFLLRNPVPDLSQIQPGDWIQQDKGDQDGEERWAEVQKKMTPWRLGIQEQEPELGLVPQQRAARLGKMHSALLVVASLIDKPTNLGGYDNRDDQFPRVCVVAFLSRLHPSNQLHERLMEELVLRLLKKDEAISKSKQRYYSNSLQHRVKNRVWQTLLMLLPKLRGEFVGTVLGRVFEAGFVSNQASVKYLIEWKMVLILVQYPEHIDRLWACFSVDQEKTKTSVCTFLSVLVHLNIIMPQLKEKAVQWRKALDVILQWCFSHNFSVRLYALLALKRVWGLEGARAEAEEGAGGADGLGGLATVVKACLHQAEAMQSTGNANKNWTRIQDHFFFGGFHPVRDYSVETIFYTFPSLSEVFEDEWIPPWKFEKLVDFSQSASFLLRNPVPDLSQIQPGDWIQQDKGDQDGEERWAEVQKKMTPWRLGIQEQEPELGLVPQQRAARLGKMHSALLVVASLIDKPTNLGGLCRTCEIFGASALVLDSLRHVSDKHFQALSVSSELWLPLLEVKPVELADFLQLKKREGYCIVGVEQTANSQSLKDYKFPEKTLLLLGNEREGIPANLLQLLDVCVEIPQQGVIRSLNVHVSAALLVWEYTRQYLPSTGVKSD